MMADSPTTEPDVTRLADPSVGASDTLTQTPNNASAVPVGQWFGRYEALELIGGGGMGIVWKARDRETGQIVALKTLQRTADAPTSLVERFLVEASAVARLRHPNIVPIFHFDRHQGQPYFTMPYLPAGSLARHRERFRDRRAAVALIEKVARAMHHAHINGVLHRDMKPGNILLDDADEPMVTDFGLAKLVDATHDLTCTGMPLGTAPYMSPEQASFQHEAIGPASDIWGLGVTLYELLLNRRPFNGSRTEELTPQILRDDPPRPVTLEADFDRALESIVLKCLEKSPARRYESAAALADDLHNWLAGNAVQAKYDPRQTPAAVRRRNRRLFLAGSAVAGLTAVLGGTSWWFADREQSQSRKRILTEELQSPLKLGKPVELLGNGGKPRWEDWPLGTCRTSTAGGAVTLNTTSPRLLELLPSTLLSSYRLSADVRLDNGTGYGGVYVGRSAQTGRSALYQCCLLLSIGAQPGGTESTRWHVDAIFAQNGGTAGPRKIGFKPEIHDDVLSKDGWVSLSIEVGNNEFIAKLEPDQKRSIKQNELLDEVSKTTGQANPSLAGARPAFSPFEGLGLYAHDGMVSFRNVIVAPLR